MKKFFAFLALAVLLLGAAAGSILILINQIKELTAKLPQEPAGYSVEKLGCEYQPEQGAKIIINFLPSQPAQKKTPSYQVTDWPQEARTEILFHKVSEVNTAFLYNEVLGNPLVADLSYQKNNSDFLINIKRRGAITPVSVSANDSNIIILLQQKDNKDYPEFSQLSPEKDSAVFPAEQKISLRVALASSLQQATVAFQGKLVNFTTTTLENPSATSQKPYLYQISFQKKLNKNETYRVSAIITDSQNRAAAIAWEFASQLPPQRGVLGPDRFKYLGWWGQINYNGTRVRKEPSTKSEMLGELATMNRVKVLDEVAGEEVEGNNHWYQIDGGQYAGAYVFSKYITHLPQPEPPKDFMVPKEVKENEYWIDVNTKKEIFTLFQYNKPVFVTYVSTGRAGSETVTSTNGVFHIYYKLVKKRMRDNPPNFEHGYDIPDVPWTMFYHDSYAIHGTFWHDRFGTRQSAGCTNMTQGDAKYVFSKTLPQLPEDRNQIKAKKENEGTVVYNHE